MQDIHSIGAGTGRLFGVADRRLRPHHHQGHQAVALKCPRCDSLNTKFCYYNNYNLSQPRHFCKGCRRYWTKGGVLRNVPVGGGCRKTKRSKPKTNSSVDDRKSNSHSSSESSRLTATTTAAAATTTVAPADVGSATTSTSAPTLLNFPDSRFFNIPPPASANFDPQLTDQPPDGGIFADAGNFTSMMTSSNDSSFLGSNMADISSYRLSNHHNHGQVPPKQSSDHHQWQHQTERMTTSAVADEANMQQIAAGFLDQTAQIDGQGLQNRANNCGLAPLDWQAGGSDQGLFDLTGTVDHGYWSQTQWTDNNHNNNDHSLYLP